MSIKNVPLRQLACNGPTIPALGLGLMGMSAFYGTAPSDEKRLVVLNRAVQLGAMHWDSYKYTSPNF